MQKVLESSGMKLCPGVRTGDFSGGVVAGAKAILSTIKGTYTNSTAYTSTPELGLWKTFAIAVAIGTIIGLFLGAGRRINGGIIGGIIAFWWAFPQHFLSVFLLPSLPFSS